MAHNQAVVVPQIFVTVVGPLLAQSSKPNRHPGPVMAEQLWRDDELRPILRKIVEGKNVTPAEQATLPPLIAGSWDQVIAHFKGE